MRYIISVVGVVLIFGHSSVQAQNVVFTDWTAAPGGTGQTWGAAFNDLQDALDSARVLALGGGEVQVWVAKGTYRADRGTVDRTVSFQLTDDIAIYGGFAGHETQLHQRDVVNNPTVLSGDLLGNDPSATVNVMDPLLADNSVHVIDGSGVGPTAVLDGFTVSAGVAYVQGGTIPQARGGAIYIEGGSPTIRECTLVGNLASSEGGAAFCWLGSSPTFVGCAIRENYAQKGGGISHVDNGVLTLIDSGFTQNVAVTEGGSTFFTGVKIDVDSCTFVGNVAQDGAAVFDRGSVGNYSDCRFEANTATGGPVLNNKSEVRSSFTACEFISNRSASGPLTIDNHTNVFTLSGSRFEDNVCTGGGGGLFIRRGSGEISSSEFRGNLAGVAGGAIFCDAGGVRIESCLFENNSAVGTGGAIKATPIESISNCTFRNNTAFTGGALWSDDGRCVDSVFEGNISTARGGAVHCERDLILENCTFLSNQADSGGAVSLDRYANPTITQCIFSGNEATTNGGAISSIHLAVPREFSVVECDFVKNTAAHGGAIHGDGSNAELSWCRFEENSATVSGGAICNTLSDPRLDHCSFVMNVATDLGGAMYNDQNSDAFLSNCLLLGNMAAKGGGFAGVQFSDLNAVNCTVVANGATDVGGGLWLIDNGEALLRNSILWGNSDKTGAGEEAQIYLGTGAAAVPRYSCIEGWTGSLGGVGNQGGYPDFRNELGPDGVPGTGDEDLRLESGSPCVDAGDGSAVPLTLIVDLDRLARIVDDPLTLNTGPGAEPHVDLGVYEVQIGECYADCDKSTGVGILDIFDFLCFQQSYVVGEPYACDCDVSTGVGVCDIFDFLCFQSSFTAGCP